MAAVVSEQKYDPLSAHNSPPSNPTAARNAVSCTECQRRKQKCSKEWPCNHCCTRRVANLCTFSSKSASSARDGRKDSPTGAKRKGASDVSAGCTPADMVQLPEDGLNDDMAELGYMRGTDQFNVQQAAGIRFQNVVNGIEREASLVRQDQIEAPPPEIPTRSLTDTLVHGYLNHFNYHYFSTYPPAFLEKYVAWWDATTAGRPIPKSFTSLLLRILACAAQWAKDDERRQIEYELAANAQSLTEKYFAAADRLSQQTIPGSGGLDQVEQLFLAACWLKAEARFVESWRALGNAIREAQEQGLQQDTASNGVEMKEWEHALRRRVWCVLYVWDFYMAGWLGRPFIIDQNSCHIDTSLLRIDQAGAGPDPFALITLQCELIQIVSKIFAKFGSKPKPSDQLFLQQKVDEWRRNLPSFLRLENKDVTFDAKHQFVNHQCLQLHATVTMMRLNPLKLYLVHPVEPASTLEDDELRRAAVQHCLDLLSVTHRLYDDGVDPKDHLVIFCLFDTAATACSAVVHGVGKKVGREEELRNAIDETLIRLSALAQVSKPSAMSWRILSRLHRRLPKSTRVAPTPKKARVQRPAGDEPRPTLESENTVVGNGTGSVSLPTTTSSSKDPLPWINPNGFDPNTSTPQEWDAGGDFSGFDYAGLEQVWNWQTLNLDPYTGNPT